MSLFDDINIAEPFLTREINKIKKQAKKTGRNHFKNRRFIALCNVRNKLASVQMETPEYQEYKRQKGWIK